MAELIFHTDGVSSTHNLHFASYLKATGQLPFIGNRLEADGRTFLFDFEDSERIMPLLYLEFERGSEAPATKLFSSLKSFRRSMTQTLQEAVK